jgi:hypothetical protein
VVVVVLDFAAEEEVHDRLVSVLVLLVVGTKE